MNKKRVIVFDFDGTIADSMNLEHQALLNTIHNYGNEDITDDNIEDHFGPTESGILKEILGEETFIEAWPIFIEEYIRLQSSLLKTFLDIDELLHSLAKEDIKLILMTGRSKETCDISLSFLNLENIFSEIYTGSDKGINKDKNMLSLMKELDVIENDILYIGDSLADIKTMRKVNIDILSVTYAGKKEDVISQMNIENKDNVISSVNELKNRVFSLIKVNQIR